MSYYWICVKCGKSNSPLRKRCSKCNTKKLTDSEAKIMSSLINVDTENFNLICDYIDKMYTSMFIYEETEYSLMLLCWSISSAVYIFFGTESTQYLTEKVLNGYIRIIKENCCDVDLDIKKMKDIAINLKNELLKEFLKTSDYKNSQKIISEKIYNLIKLEDDIELKKNLFIIAEAMIYNALIVYDKNSVKGRKKKNKNSKKEEHNYEDYDDEEYDDEDE